MLSIVFELICYIYGSIVFILHLWIMVNVCFYLCNKLISFYQIFVFLDTFAW